MVPSLAKWVMRGLAALSTRPRRAARPKHTMKQNKRKDNYDAMPAAPLWPDACGPASAGPRGTQA